MREPLRNILDILYFRRQIGRIKNLRNVHVKTQCPKSTRLILLPKRKTYRNRSIVLKCQHGNRLKRRCRFAKKIDHTTFAARRLIDEKCHQALLFEYSNNVGRTAIFGNQKLAGRLAEVLDELVQIRIIQGASNGMRRISQHAERKSADFKVAEMSRNDDHGPVLVQYAQERFGIDESNVIRPVEVADFSPGECNFDSHEEKVFPHFVDEALPFFFISFGKGDLQIFVEQSAADGNDAGEEDCKSIGKEFAGSQTQRLDDAKYDSD